MTSTTDSTRTATTEQLPVVDAARLTVNGLDRPWTVGLTVEAVVRDLLGEGAPAARATGTPADTGCATGVAVALDDAIVPRGLWGTTPVPAGARVEVVTAVQGG